MGKAIEKKTFLTVLLVLLGLEVVNLFPSLILLISIPLSLFFIFALYYILRIKPKEKLFYPVFILPLILLAEAFIVINAVPLSSLKHLFVSAFGLLLYLVIFSLSALRAHILSYSVIIFNILTVAYLVSIFFAYIIIYNFYLLFKLPPWSVMLFIGLITFFFFRFNLWQNDLLKKEHYVYSFILTIIIVEFFWVLSFFPLLALSAGFVLFLIYYIYSDLFKMSLNKSLTRSNLLNHIIIPLFVIIFFLASVKW